MALCRFRITPAQFYELTPIEFDFALKDFNKLEEMHERADLERMRMQTWYFVNTQIKDPLSEPKKLFRLPWEHDEVQIHIPTDEDWERFDNIAKKIWQGKQSTN